MNSTAFLWMIIIPLACSPLVYLIGRIGVRQNILQRRTYIVRWAALAALLATWVPFIMVLQQSGQNLLECCSGSMFAIETIWLQMDGVSLLLTGIVLTLGTLVVLFSGPYMEDEIGEEKYYAMLLAMIGIMIGLGCASDLFNLWVWFEAMAVSSYLLVAFYRRQAPSLEAGMKYLVQSATGSVLVMFGIALVLANTGVLSLKEIQFAIANTDPNASLVDRLPLLAAGAFFLIGYGVKVALVPMHTWLPDAHSQAPSSISAMLSGVVIETGLVALLRTLATLAGVSSSWGILLMGFGALNMIYGNLLALRQTQIKRMLAYSSLSHIGYMLIGLGIGFYLYSTPAQVEVAQNAVQGAFFHMINHGLMKGLAFLAVGAFLFTLRLAFENHEPLSISDLAGASKRYPLAALTLSIALLALGGLPPLAGFMSKWQIFVAGFGTNNGWIIALVIFAALNSVLSLAYYAPIVNIMYRQKPSQLVLDGAPMPKAMLAPLVILGLAIIAIGFWPGLMNWLAAPAGSALLTAMMP